MSEMKDFRGKITAETWCVIESEHLITGEEHSAIVREILHHWALKKIDQAKVMNRLLGSEGIVGNVRERQG